MFLATALVLYYYGVGKRIDLVSFYEYAIVYSTFFGTLPIEPDLWTALFVFAVATTFYVARAQFLRERKLSGQGAMWFAYVCCVSTYFIARSHYCNLQSIFPWLVSAMAAIRFEQSPRFRLVQRGVVFAAGAWGMVYLLSMYTNQNAKMLANRMASQEVYTLPLFEKVPADVAQAARAAAGNGRFTMINNWAVFDTSKELDYVDNSLPIGPPRHFTILDKSRRRWYVIRMMERVPESFLLYPANQGELIQEVFAGSMDRVNLQEIKYPFSGQWKLLQVKRVGS